MYNQSANQPNPSIPENTKDQRQPKTIAIQGITRAARAPPTLEPLSKIATARLRSSLGNHSATVLLAPGQLKPSPIPSRNRNAATPTTELAKPVSMFICDHKLTPS